MTVTTTSRVESVPRITGLPALRVLAEMGSAAIVAGVIVRRPPMMKAIEKVQADRAAVRCMHRLRAEYGDGPVELVIPGRRIVIITHPDDVGRVLSESPDPFTPANREKRAALSPFQPHAVLISTGDIRTQRRVVNVAALDTPRSLHRMATPMAAVIAEEVSVLLDQVLPTGVLDADALLQCWWRVVRRVTLGDSARDDETTTQLLRRLRAAGNWSLLSRAHPGRREQFFERLYDHVERAEPGSLAAALNEIPTAPAVDPIGQMPHWLFAFDAAGMAMSRTLALLSTHYPAQHRALDEAAQGPARAQLDFLRTCVLESVRLWPTTPTILRDTVADTHWGPDGDRRVAAGAAVLIHASAFHRDGSDDHGADYADRFEPDIWSDGRAAARPDLVPFSAGPAQCPGQNLVLFATSTFLARILQRARVCLQSSPTLSPTRPLPMSLDNFGLRFAVEARGRS